MTTIAYRNGVLAGDRQCGINGWINPYSVPKLFSLGQSAGHAIAAVTGDYQDALRLIEWFRQPFGDRPKLGDNSRVIILRARDELTIYEGAGSFDIETEFAAWGSGMPAATAALIMGATARRAVEVAAMLDEGTSADIDVLPIEGVGRDHG